KEATWTASHKAVGVHLGVASVSSPGSYQVTVSQSGQSATAPWTVSLSGPIYGGGLGPTEAARLDAMPSAKTSLAYPLANALFPATLAAVTVQIAKMSASQVSARIAVSGTNLDIKYYAPCEAGPHSDQGCYVSLPAWLTGMFATASELADLRLSARLVAADG